ncbi:MAG: TldD/PmbA family protein [Lachnospiraceae bacterium]|nr:TldD/PmbA family protein [Lachnospiraceae bacterium]
MKDLKELSAKIDSLLESKGITKNAYSVSQIETQEFNMEDGEFSLLRTLFDNSVAVTSFVGEKQGIATGNDFTDEGLEATVSASVEAANSAEPDACKDIAPNAGSDVFNLGCLKPDKEKFFERLLELQKDIKEKYPKIKVMVAIAKYSSSHQLYKNTNGTEFETNRGRYMVLLEFAGNDGAKTTSFNGAEIMVTELDKPFIEYDSIRVKLDESVAALNETKFEGKFEGQVILTPDALVQFISFIIMNYLADSVILEGTSRWLDKLNEKVADERITIINDPFSKEIISDGMYTSDGFRGETTPIIEKGVLKNFFLTLYAANKTGREPAKIPGGNFIVANGDTPYAEMIKSMKKGLIVGGFSGGMPAANGEFSGVAKNSFLVENGEIKGAVTETMINGNLGEMFNHLVSISKETINSGQMILPYYCVDGIVISGK